MDKKESIKISLSMFLLIIALIVIFIMGYFMYKMYTEKVSSEEKVNDLNGQVNALQEKIDKVEEIANNTLKYNNTNSERVNFSENEIKQTLTNYLNIFKGYGSPVGLLNKLGLLNYGDYTSDNLTADNYIKTNIKYSDFKETVLNYITEDLFNSINDNQKWEINLFKEKEGLLYYYNAGWTGTVYEVKNIRIKGDYSNLAYIADVYTVNDDGSKELNTIEFHIANVNGKCVISYSD